MKIIPTILLFCCLLQIASCSSDDKILPAPVNEVEFITTVKMTFTPQSGGLDVVLQYKDLDGDGGNEPIITANRSFEQSKIYNGNIIIKNELANPPIDITAEIVSESLEHQFFYQTTGNIPQFRYANVASNFDRNGKPFGIQSVFNTATASVGTLQLTLRHGPNKNGANVSNGIIDNAGGATDIEVRFNIIIE
jgi:hypothetical protein